SSTRRSSTLLLSKTPPPPARYTLSLHDALPILPEPVDPCDLPGHRAGADQHLHDGRPGLGAGAVLLPILLPFHQPGPGEDGPVTDRKSTRLNSSHVKSSYAVFCSKKKKSVRW